MRMLVNIDVPEIASAAAFYRAAIGLELSRMISDDVAELSGESSTIYLLRNAAGSDPSSAAAEPRRYTRHWTPVHIDFVVDDLTAATRRAIAAGANQASDCVRWNGSKCISFSDPFGNGFCLIHFEAGTYRGDDV